MVTEHTCLEKYNLHRMHRMQAFTELKSPWIPSFSKSYLRFIVCSCATSLSCWSLFCLAGRTQDCLRLFSHSCYIVEMSLVNAAQLVSSPLPSFLSGLWTKCSGDMFFGYKAKCEHTLICQEKAGQSSTTSTDSGDWLRNSKHVAIIFVPLFLKRMNLVVRTHSVMLITEIQWCSQHDWTCKTMFWAYKTNDCTLPAKQNREKQKKRWVTKQTWELRKAAQKWGVATIASNCLHSKTLHQLILCDVQKITEDSYQYLPLNICLTPQNSRPEQFKR